MERCVLWSEKYGSPLNSSCYTVHIAQLRLHADLACNLFEEQSLSWKDFFLLKSCSRWHPVNSQLSPCISPVAKWCQEDVIWSEEVMHWKCVLRFSTSFQLQHWPVLSSPSISDLKMRHIAISFACWWSSQYGNDSPTPPSIHHVAVKNPKKEPWLLGVEVRFRWFRGWCKTTEESGSHPLHI